MCKPIVFLSHSSKDKERLAPFKEMLLKKTGGTIEVFLSSDGQSIPFGRNWITKIEEALNRAKLMFVFVSWNSLDSHWLFFESGYAYSKGIKVIPVGILGVDLSRVAPPVGLLQGFNINSEEGLNNVLDVINKECEHQHVLDFSRSEYDVTLGAQNRAEQDSLAYFSPVITSVEMVLKECKGDVLSALAALFESAGTCYQRDTNKVSTFGFVMELAKEDFIVTLDASVAAAAFLNLDKAIATAGIKQVAPVSLTVNFDKGIQLVSGVTRMTARLSKTAVALSTQGGLSFGGMNFELDRQMSLSFLGRSSTVTPPRARIGPARIRGEYGGNALAEMPLGELIQILFDAEVLYEDPYGPPLLQGTH